MISVVACVACLLAAVLLFLTERNGRRSIKAWEEAEAAWGETARRWEDVEAAWEKAATAWEDVARRRSGRAT